MDCLTKLTKLGLFKRCEELGLKKYRNLKKQDIINLIKESDKKESDKKENMFIIGDNIILMKQLENESIDLIYFDPPYNTGRDFFNFNDKFNSKTEYISFMKVRIEECYRILKHSGTLVIHIEPRISHYFRFICDEIFGEINFKNEIVWQTGGNSKNKYKLNRYHDTILVYAKSSKQIFNPIYFKYDETYKKNQILKYVNFITKNM